MHDERQASLLDGQCPSCGDAEIHAPDCPEPGLLVHPREYADAEERSRRARLLFLEQARDTALDLLARQYVPRLRALHDEWRAKVDEAEERFREQARELAAS